ncbi:TetR family transcriptional regulator [Paractinoplanes lichenicola]|uniref:TetR family transcriptional regulator n=1 Tax=Paractinoplanes lichenicola TaxID=2802976 RepID=A0ABS1VWJ2_9ACTN|nr:TetR family transcriptional regulator [Actinoplanes lichenicola]MBL7258857.1 TetR family transcriptional regulator [Actinoplanes lichenicola]
MDSTGDRILAAATAEFSQHGVAGARIERIAKTARTSKERIYAYFRSKEALYRHVLRQELGAVAEATRMDPTDLPEYAGRIHDYFTSHPERYRLMTWGQMEPAPDDDPIRDATTYKLEKLAQAQKDGVLDPAWDPIDILIFVNQIAMSWVALPSHVPAEQHESFMADRRAAIVAAVERLFPAAGGSAR